MAKGTNTKLQVVMEGRVDNTKAVKSIQDFRQQAASKPITLNVNLNQEQITELIGGVGKGGAFRTASRDSYKQMMASIIPDAKTIDSVKVYAGMVGQVNEKGELVGPTYEKARSAVVRFTTDAGQKMTAYVNLLNQGEQAVGRTAMKYETDYGKMARSAERALNTEKALMDRKIDNADKWLATSKNISSKDVARAETFRDNMVRDNRTWLAALDVMQANSKQSTATQKQAYADASQAASKAKESFQKNAKELDKIEASLRRGSGSLRTWGEAFANAMKQTIAYTFTIGLIQRLNSEIQRGIDYVYKLSEQMVKIQVLQVQGARTNEEIKTLAENFNKLAQEMGASTIEVAKGSVEWLRQGRTVTETGKLLKSSLMLSKLGAIDSAQATEYLTAITNGFKIEAEDAASVVDRLIAVDNIAATSSSELATAMRYTSVSAQQAGVTMEQLISYIATVSSVSRGSAESIGQAFKTIFARMQDMKQGVAVEEGGTISNVEMSLKEVGVQLRDSQQEFRNMGDVLEEVAGKWSNLSETQKTEIAKNIAGIRQRETFFILMENMNKALEYQTAQTNAAGLATDRYGIYMESTGAKAAALQASIEGMWQQTIDSTSVKVILDLTKGFIDLQTAVGGLVPSLSVIAGLMLVISSDAKIKSVLGMADAYKKLTVFFNRNGIMGLTTSWKLLLIPFQQIAPTMQKAGEAISFLTNRQRVLHSTSRTVSRQISNLASGIGMLTIGIGIAAMAFNAYSQKMQESLEKQRTAYQDSISKTRQLADAKDTLIKEYKELSENLNRTTEENIRFKNIQNEIKNLIPTLEGSYSALGDFMLNAAENADTLNAKLDGQIERINHINSLRYIYGNQEGFNWGAPTLLQEQAGKMATAAAYYESAQSETQKFADQEISKRKEIAQITENISKATTLQEKRNWEVQLDTANKALEEIVGKRKSAYDEEQIAYSNWLTEATALYDAYQKTAEEDKPAFLQKIDEFFKTSMGGRLAYTGSKMFEQFMSDKATSDAWARIAEIQGKNAGEAASKVSRGAYLGGLDEIQQITERKGLIEGLFKDLGKVGIEDIPNVIKLAAKYGVDYNTLLKEIGGQTYINKDAVLELELAYQSQTIALAENADETEANISSMKNYQTETQKLADLTAGGVVYGMRISGETIKQAGADIAQAAWAAAQGTGITFKDIAGNLLGTQDALQQAMTGSFAEFVNILSQITAAGLTSNQNLASIIAGWQSYTSGVTPYAPAPASFGGGGGGGGGESAEQTAAKERIKELEKQKKALEDRRKEYQKYIDLKKLELKLQKEEKDFLDALENKNKSLMKLREEILILSLDDSEEARSKRLQKEDEAAKLEEEITKEKEDRKYEIQVQALEDQMRKFDEMIDKQIEGLDKTIEKLQEVSNASSGGGSAMTQMGNQGDAALWKIINDITNFISTSSTMTSEIGTMTEEWISQGFTLDQIIIKLATIASFYNVSPSAFGSFASNELYGESLHDRYNDAAHQTALNNQKNQRHSGGFAGDLKTNEVFEKLLKGEYVATESQMKNFINTSLPNMAKLINTGGGGINVSMPITVQGNLDSSVVPDIEKITDKMMKKLTGIMKERGNIRQTTLTSI